MKEILKIVVAEDELQIQRFIASAYEQYGDVKVAGDIPTLFKLIEEDVNAVLLDLTMPPYSAARTVSEVIPEVRRRIPNSTLIVVTGHGDMYREEAIKAGADLYVQKTDLQGFKQAVMLKILSDGALSAMARGVDASTILRAVATSIPKLNQAA